MDIHSFAEVLEEEDGEFATEVFAELIEACKNAAVAGGVGPIEGGVIGFQAELLENVEDALGMFGFEETDFFGVNRVERESDRDGFGVGELVVGESLHFVSRPMAEVEGPA